GNQLQLDKILNYCVEILHALEPAVAHRVQQRLALGFAGFNVLASTRCRFQDLDRRDASTHVGARNQTLRDDVAEGLRQTSTNYRLFILRVETDDAVDRLGRIDSVQS